MKTAVIYNRIEQLDYFIVNEDITHLQGVYVNSVGTDPNLEQELISLVYGDNPDETKGEVIHKLVTVQEIQQAVHKGAALIECGFLP